MALKPLVNCYCKASDRVAALVRYERRWLLWVVWQDTMILILPDFCSLSIGQQLRFGCSHTNSMSEECSVFVGVHRFKLKFPELAKLRVSFKSIDNTQLHSLSLRLYHCTSIPNASKGVAVTLARLLLSRTTAAMKKAPIHYVRE